MRNCPFCNEKAKRGFPHFYLMEDGDWVFSHHCKLKPFPSLTGCITIYGASEQEVIDIWNGVYEEPKSESL